MTRYRYEYRINKKGAECYRTDSYEMAKEKLQALSEKRPGVYTMQQRKCLVDRYGVLNTDICGKASWTCWS